ncbi:YdaU family protein [Ramlibacter sp.]|uniref:YdaU family protein n=1 Tax=Ramlibacter sp. TaxID=1917967 RepID=UPI002FCA49BD
MAKHDTWMPFYPADYLRDTMDLTTEEHGAYLLLILAAWQEGGALDNDQEALRRITRLSKAQWDRARPRLQRFFEVAGGKWLQKRVRREWEKARANTERKSRAGTVGAKAKWRHVQGEDGK